MWPGWPSGGWRRARLYLAGYKRQHNPAAQVCLVRKMLLIEADGERMLESKRMSLSFSKGSNGARRLQVFQAKAGFDRTKTREEAAKGACTVNGGMEKMVAAHQATADKTEFT